MAEMTTPPNAAELNGVAVRYANGALGVSDISFHVRAGQIVALFGPNGAGKTTSVRALCGFMKSERAAIARGHVSLFGRTVTGYEPHRTARLGVAFVPERHKVFANLSVADNLRAMGDLPGKAEFAQRVEHALDVFPALATRRHEIAGRLSGGQQQMLAMARSMIRDPRLLVVDELTLGLHHSMHAPLFDALKRIQEEGASVVVVDESIGFALDLADYCYLLIGGTVRDHGPAERFRDNELLAAGYLEVSM
jgi:branched-chain amino acid transport system ATP-binding protein